MRRYRVALGIGLLLLAFAGAAPAMAEYRGTDVFTNTALPASDAVGGLAAKYPITRYSLDSHIDAGALHPAGIPETISNWFTKTIWSVVSLVSSLVMQLFTFAFGLKLLTGAGGLLDPVASAIKSMYDNAVGGVLFACGIVVCGVWAIWTAFVKRHTSQAFAGIGLSILLMVVSLMFILTPQETIRTTSETVDELSSLGLTGGAPGDASNARQHMTDKMFTALVVAPWEVLQFGGLQTCVDPAQTDKDGVPKPVGPSASGAKCRPNAEFAHRYLVQAPGSDERDAEYEAIKNGKVPTGDPQFPASYKLSAADRPAVDMQQEGGAGQRFLMVLLIAIADGGLLVIVGSLSILIIVAQLIALVVLGFAPFVLLASCLPGPGHGMALGWLSKLFSTLTVKVVYSFTLAIVVTIGLSLLETTAAIGWMWSLIFTALYYWSLFFARHRIQIALLGRRGSGGFDKAIRRPMRTLADTTTVVGAAKRLHKSPTKSATAASSSGEDQNDGVQESVLSITAEHVHLHRQPAATQQQNGTTSTTTTTPTPTATNATLAKAGPTSSNPSHPQNPPSVDGTNGKTPQPPVEHKMVTGDEPKMVDGLATPTGRPGPTDKPHYRSNPGAIVPAPPPPPPSQTVPTP
jgi:hypothetical protein